MTLSEFIAQFIAMGIIGILFYFFVRNGKLAMKEFSTLWIQNEDAKILSFPQLLLAVATKSSFVQESKLFRQFFSASLGCLIATIFIILQGKMLYSMAVTAINDSPAGDIVIFTEDDIKRIYEFTPNK